MAINMASLHGVTSAVLFKLTCIHGMPQEALDEIERLKETREYVWDNKYEENLKVSEFYCSL